MTTTKFATTSDNTAVEVTTRTTLRETTIETTAATTLAETTTALKETTIETTAATTLAETTTYTFTGTTASTTTAFTSHIPAETSTIRVTSTNEDADNSGAPIGAIIGGVLAGLLVLVVIIVIVICIIKRRKKETKKEPVVPSSPKNKPNAKAPGRQTLKEVMKQKRQTVVNLFTRTPTGRKESVDINNLQYVQTTMPVALKRLSERNSTRQTSKTFSEIPDTSEGENTRPPSLSSTESGNQNVECYVKDTHPHQYATKADVYPISTDGSQQEDYFNIAAVSTKDYAGKELGHQQSIHPTIDQEDYMNSSQLRGQQCSDHHNSMQEDIIDDDEIITHNRGRRPTFDEFGLPPPVPHVQLNIASKATGQRENYVTVPKLDSVIETVTDEQESEGYSYERRPTFADLGIAPPVPQFEQEEYMNIVQVAHTPKQSQKVTKVTNMNGDYITSTKGFLETLIPPPSGGTIDAYEQEDYVKACDVAELSNYASPSSISIHGDSAQEEYATPSSISIHGRLEQEEYATPSSISIESIQKQKNRTPAVGPIAATRHTDDTNDERRTDSEEVKDDYLDMTPKLAKRNITYTPTEKRCFFASKDPGIPHKNGTTNNDETMGEELPDYASPSSISIEFGRTDGYPAVHDRNAQDEDEPEDEERMEGELPDYATPSSISVNFGRPHLANNEQDHYSGDRKYSDTYTNFMVQEEKYKILLGGGLGEETSDHAIGTGQTNRHS